MTEEELIKTYPENTVFVLESDGKIELIQTAEYYARMGKSYEDCLTKAKSKNSWRIMQSKEIYFLAKKLEDNKKTIGLLNDYLDWAREIGCEINNFIDDMESYIED